MRALVWGIALFVSAFQAATDQEFLELISRQHLETKDLFGRSIGELEEILGEPTQFADSSGQMYGRAVWKFKDYEIEASFHPVTNPIINFLFFTPTNPDTTMDKVLHELSLDEFNGSPSQVRTGVWRWRKYIAQKTEFERITWYDEDHSLAIKK